MANQAVKVPHTRPSRSAPRQACDVPNRSDLARSIADYAETVRKISEQWKAPTTPKEAAALWSMCAHALLSVVDDPIKSRRGAWLPNGTPDAPMEPPAAPSRLRTELSTLISSAAARGVGPHLERGLQFCLHIPRSVCKDFLTSSIHRLLQDSKKGTYKPTDEATNLEWRDNGLLQYNSAHPPQFVKEQDRFKTILEYVQQLLQKKTNESRLALTVFTELWTYVYSHYETRDRTLGNELLRYRSGQQDAIVYTIDTRGDSGKLQLVLPPGYKHIALIDSQSAPFIDSIQLRRIRLRIVCLVLTALHHIWTIPGLYEIISKDQKFAKSGTLDDEANELIRHWGQRILVALRHPRLPHEPWCGVPEALEQLELLAVNRLGEKSHALWEANNPEFHAPDQFKIKKRWIHLALQFVLYHGDYAKLCYYVVPRQIQGRTSLRTGFSMGVKTPITPGILDPILNLHKDVAERFGSLMQNNTIADKQLGTIEGEMQTILGEDVALQLSDRIGAWDVHEALQGLPRYLRFAENLVEQATHEGRTLRFNLLVSDGIRRDDLVETIASFERMPDRDESNVVQDDLRPNQELIARLLGNFAFMQSGCSVLVGDRSGRVRALARLLRTEMLPELITKSGKSGDPASDCYLIVILDDGGIQVYYQGELTLWRRLGRYVVWQNGQYGVSYRKKMQKRILEFIEKPNHRKDLDVESLRCILDAGVLVDVIWQIAQESGHGACFVLSKWNASLKGLALNLTRIFPHADALPIVWCHQRDVLHDLAVQDGATIIDTAYGLVYGSRYLRPKVENLKEERDRLTTKYPEVLHWGTRHLMGLGLAIDLKNLNQDALIIIVSSDGDIHVFENGELIRELTYPPKAG